MHTACIKILLASIPSRDYTFTFYEMYSNWFLFSSCILLRQFYNSDVISLIDLWTWQWRFILSLEFLLYVMMMIIITRTIIIIKKSFHLILSTYWHYTILWLLINTIDVKEMYAELVRAIFPTRRIFIGTCYLTQGWNNTQFVPALFWSERTLQITFKKLSSQFKKNLHTSSYLLWLFALKSNEGKLIIILWYMKRPQGYFMHVSSAVDFYWLIITAYQIHQVNSNCTMQFRNENCDTASNRNACIENYIIWCSGKRHTILVILLNQYFRNTRTSQIIYQMIRLIEKSAWFGQLLPLKSLWCIAVLVI